MTYKEFLLEVQQAGMSLNESEGTYYFNLWGETMRQDRKAGQSHDFSAYVAWMIKQ